MQPYPLIATALPHGEWSLPRKRHVARDLTEARLFYVQYCLFTVVCNLIDLIIDEPDRHRRSSLRLLETKYTLRYEQAQAELLDYQISLNAPYTYAPF